MKQLPALFEKESVHIDDAGNIEQSAGQLTKNDTLIRFEERKETYTWIEPAEIIFVKSADHYVRSLVRQGENKKWMIRHCTLKEMFALLTQDHFIRLNRFYLVNRDHFSFINENEKTLYFRDGSSIPVPHRISRFIINMLNNSNT